MREEAEKKSYPKTIARWKERVGYPTTEMGRALWRINRICAGYERKYSAELAAAREKMAREEAREEAVKEAQDIVSAVCDAGREEAGNAG